MLPRVLIVLAVAAMPAGAAQSGAVSAVSKLPRPIRAMSSSVRPAEAALVGTIEKFEPKERELVLKIRDGHHVTFTLADAAVVRMGSKRLPTTDLGKHSGRRAKIRFTEADGKRTAHWVTIASEAPKTAP